MAVIYRRLSTSLPPDERAKVQARQPEWKKERAQCASLADKDPSTAAQENVIRCLSSKYLVLPEKVEPGRKADS
jgi:uncharacterized protein